MLFGKKGFTIKENEILRSSIIYENMRDDKKISNKKFKKKKKKNRKNSAKSLVNILLALKNWNF